jgi:hypothetical protein
MTAKVLETCIKVVNLLAPYARGGKIGLFGSAGVMPPQGLASSVPTPTQYFLAIFTFFSFFNSPFSSYSHATPTGPTHSGIVLTDSGIFITPPVSHFWLRRLVASLPSCHFWPCLLYYFANLPSQGIPTYTLTVIVTQLPMHGCC